MLVQINKSAVQVKDKMLCLLEEGNLEAYAELRAHLVNELLPVLDLIAALDLLNITVCPKEDEAQTEMDEVEVSYAVGTHEDKDGLTILHIMAYEEDHQPNFN